jgi:cell division protein FtsB
MAYHVHHPSALCLTLILAVACAPVLSAQTTSLEDRVAALEKQLSALAAENKALKEKQAAKPSAVPLTAAGK